MPPIVTETGRKAQVAAPTRRSFLTGSAVATAAGLSGISLATTSQAAAAATPPGVVDADGQYYASLAGTLKDHGVFQPTLVIDRDRLEANIDVMLQHLAPGVAFRAVTKSLPILPLLDIVRARTSSNRLMVFNQPFLRTTVERWNDSQIFLGKPMPVRAAAAFYDGLSSAAINGDWSVQWLVDTPERLAQYGEMASEKGKKLDIALELDVGFHRGGIPDIAGLDESLAIIAANPNLNLTGLMGYDAHVSIFPKYIGPPEESVPRTNRRFEAFIERAKSLSGVTNLTLNTAGSTTYQLYSKGRFPTPANDIAIGSGLLKPTFCDAALPNHTPAVFITTPVLKQQDGVSVPGIEHFADGGAGDNAPRGQTVFLYGGKWMAKPVHPAGMIAHPIYGRSSNQDMFNLPANVPVKADDLVLFRPTQTEMVLSQFADILVVSGGEVVDNWGSGA